MESRADSIDHASGILHRDLKPKHQITSGTGQDHGLGIALVKTGPRVSSPQSSSVRYLCIPGSFATTAGYTVGSLFPGYRPLSWQQVHPHKRPSATMLLARGLPSSDTSPGSPFFDGLVIALLARDRTRRSNRQPTWSRRSRSGEQSTWWAKRSGNPSRRPLRPIGSSRDRFSAADWKCY
jgi:hypothetical protein